MSEDTVARSTGLGPELGMEIAALSAALDAPPGSPNESLTDNFDKVVADCRRLSCSMVRIGMMPLSAMASKETLLDFCSRSNEMAGRLAEAGINLCYHNHHNEFANYDGQYVLDIIRESAPSLRFDSLATSRENLVKLGYADLF